MAYAIYSLEDDKDISHIINVTLAKAGYEIYSFGTSADFFASFNNKKPNMVLLDLMLPDMSGTDVLKKIRENPSNDDIQIIIISAKRMMMDKVDGLDLGADDYIEKPFDILELISRVNAKVRRYYSSHILSYKNIVVDLKAHRCSNGDETVSLTNMEFQILEVLLVHQGNLVSRDEIISNLYGEDVSLETRSIDMHIASIRKKLGDTDASTVRTIYGLGYQIG